MPRSRTSGYNLSDSSMSELSAARYRLKSVNRLTRSMTTSIFKQQKSVPMAPASSSFWSSFGFGKRTDQDSDHFAMRGFSVDPAVASDKRFAGLLSTVHATMEALGKALSSERKLDTTAHEIAALREVIFATQELTKCTSELLFQVERRNLQLTARSTRSDYMHTLSELIGAPPPRKVWSEEWHQLNVETCVLVALQGLTSMSLSQKERQECVLRAQGYSIENKLAMYADAISWKVERGWSHGDARAHTCLGGVVGAALGKALQENSSRYAASTYAVCLALQRAAKLQAETSPPVFVELDHGANSAAWKDAHFRHIEQPDVHGFRGFTCCAELHAYDDPLMFPEDGGFMMRGRYEDGQPVYEPNEGPVLKIVSSPNDSSGLHSAVETGPGGDGADSSNALSPQAESLAAEQMCPCG